MQYAVSAENWAHLRKSVAGRISSRDRAADRLHSAFVRLAEHPTGVDNPSAYLIRTAVNLEIDDFRRSRIVQTVPLEYFDDSLPLSAPLQDEALIAREKLERVREGLRRLSERTREMFLKHRLGAMKHREIAEEFGVSQSAVRKHIAKASLFLNEWASGW